MLEGLLSEDPEFGANVRKAIFTFEDIPDRLAVMEVPKVLRDIAPDDLTKALAFATAAGGRQAVSATHLLDNMSTRMADNLREEIDEAGTIKQVDGESAQNSVVTAIREAADAGTITLITKDEE